VMLRAITRFASPFSRLLATEAAKPVVATSYAEINAAFMQRLREARARSEAGGGAERVAKQV
jgi:hypothetical protein